MLFRSAPGPSVLKDRLIRQLQFKDRAKLRVATEAYLEFLELGGLVRFEDLTPGLIRRHLVRQHPILTGLSALAVATFVMMALFARDVVPVEAAPVHVAPAD